MSLRKPPPVPAPPWSVPVAVEDIAETGQHVELDADVAARAAVARTAGVREVSRLQASFDLARYGAGGVHVVGRVSATVEQTCVVTLEPLANDVIEDVDLTFLPGAAASPRASGDAAAQEGPEPLVEGRVDLGALATEFLILGLDPYPRRPGAVFAAPHAEQADAGAFAVLATLKRGQQRNDG